jgi:predicted amidohydrolase YtcJ
MGLLRVAFLVLVLAVCGCAAGAPDTVLLNGKVFTANPAQPLAAALAIQGDRIVAVGDSAAIAGLAGATTRRLDVGGRTIVPGLNDAHQHVTIWPPHDRLTLPFDPTVDEIGDALRAQIKTTPVDRPIRGDFSQAAWGNPAFTRAWLDGIAPDHAVWLAAFTGHGALLNSRALQLVGIEESIADPEGGVYGRDERGRLNGRLEEYAKSIADQRIALKTEASEVARTYRAFAAEASAWGITSVQLLGDAQPIAVASKRLVEAAIPLRVKVFRFPMREAGAETIDSRPPLPPQPSPFVDARGMKWILDGTPRERLGFLRAPYADSPGERGRLNLPLARIDQFVAWAYGSEDLLAVHAFGDAAIDA